MICIVSLAMLLLMISGCLTKERKPLTLLPFPIAPLPNFPNEAMKAMNEWSHQFISILLSPFLCDDVSRMMLV
ncbi:hypothetical protein BX070DRAFT_221850 [Coemansia spiralis]|nr:hypothetical protein BX070DRAFT_221850 [Coemansia spiralis]